MGVKNLSSIIFFLVCFLGYGQDIPKTYFNDPLNVPLILSGTFGELRSNHFHSGLDIKTQQRTGLKVKASASGTVSRIKISHYGYGKAIYISHPNGYTTVYAHLKKFAPEIEAYVKKQQYKKEAFEIELFPEPGALTVEQDEIIAFSGNSGSSGGPHLHFEIRDAKARPMNPFLFGLSVEDTRKPLINRILVYPLDNASHINGHHKTLELRLNQRPDGNYTCEPINVKGEIGFGLGTVDQQNLANNKNGIYAITSSYNGEVNFSVTMDRFSFAETRYLNRMIDYGYFIKNRSRVQKLFVEKNNPLSIYSNVTDNGVLQITDTLSHHYMVKVKDYKNNEVTITIPIMGTSDSLKTEIPTLDPDHHYYYSDDSYRFEEGKFEVYIPKNALYDDIALELKTEGDDLHLHRKEVPVHKNIIISYDLTGYSAADREQLFIGRYNYKNTLNYTGASIKNNKLTTGTRTFGKYGIGIDKTPPKVVPHNFSNGKWISKKTTLQLKITDDKSGIKSYRATVNGKFILMEYNYKTNTLTHDFSDNIVTETENQLKLIVTDNVGNSTTFESTFFRKN